MSVKNAYETLLSNRNVQVYVGLGACAVVSIYLVVRQWKKKKNSKTFPRDVVILHQFPRGLRCPSPSPFALKLETYIRMAGIPYKVNITLCFNFQTIKSSKFDRTHLE